MDSFFELMALLRAGRALLDLKQEELAELAGVSRSVIAKIEREDPGVVFGALEKVKAALEGRGVVFLPGGTECSMSVGFQYGKYRARKDPAAET